MANGRKGDNASLLCDVLDIVIVGTRRARGPVAGSTATNRTTTHRRPQLHQKCQDPGGARVPEIEAGGLRLISGGAMVILCEPQVSIDRVTGRALHAGQALHTVRCTGCWSRLGRPADAQTAPARRNSSSTTFDPQCDRGGGTRRRGHLLCSWPGRSSFGEQRRLARKADLRDDPDADAHGPSRPRARRLGVDSCWRSRR